MAFLVYRVLPDREVETLEATGNHFSLAGHNLIYQLWEKTGKPLDKGWHLSANDLINVYSKGKGSYETLRFIIDFDPTSKRRIGLIELRGIYIFTYPDGQSQQALWSPMMLCLRDVRCKVFDTELTPEDKKTKISVIKPKYGKEEFVEFLYLQGDNKGWNWGVNGRTNAAFIYGKARKYFQRHFCT